MSWQSYDWLPASFRLWRAFPFFVDASFIGVVITVRPLRRRAVMKKSTSANWFLKPDMVVMKNPQFSQSNKLIFEVSKCQLANRSIITPSPLNRFLYVAKCETA